MKASKNLIAAFLALIIVFISAALYENGIITDELYLKLISSVKSELVLEANDVEVHFIDVGQAESILIKTPEKAVLIDSGEIGCENAVTNYLHSNGIFHIDLFIITHPHSDHIGSAEEILSRFPVTEVAMPEIPEEYLPTTSLYEDFLIAVKKKKCTVSFIEAGSSFSLGDGIAFDILSPSGDMGDNLNNYSVVSKLSYGEVSFLFTGDIEKEVEKLLLSSKADISCDVYNAGHHGSSTSNTESFLAAANPKYAAISCGANNDYGHPHRETISLFKKLEIKYFRTDYDGNIVFGTDGENISVITSK
ncbi:MAG: MBL fold metallo-hydrolase [Oscillospiraceae bacterium]|nr:MBL fold metallo-hydrolase [Oscillospiraceae bacterium]